MPTFDGSDGNHAKLLDEEQGEEPLTSNLHTWKHDFSNVRLVRKLVHVGC